VTSTLPEVRPPSDIRRARTIRRLGITVLALFVGAGAFGAFGTRSAEKMASGGGFELSVTYPKVSRPGHAVRLEYVVKHPGGFDGPVKMRFSSDYFDLFDENAFVPSPDSITTTAAYRLCEFAPPPGDTFVITVDTRIEPARQRGTSGEVSVLDETGAPVVTVPHRTRIWP
jgi:hypothetical protein